MIRNLLVALTIVSMPASAQFAPPAVGIHLQSVVTRSHETQTMTRGTGAGMPRWVKWGIAGAVAGGALFAMAGQSDTGHNHSAAGDALYGAATGFVLVGGSIALWDWLCRGDTKSRRSGLCGG